jgi:hypothetical protein
VRVFFEKKVSTDFGFKKTKPKPTTCSFGGWLIADNWFVLKEKYCWLIADDWFVLREKYCWLIADDWFVLREKYCSLAAG